MKMRYITILYTILIGIVFIISVYKLLTVTNQPVDVIKLNERFKLVEEGLINGTDKAKLEQEFDCRIYFKNDNKYESLITKERKNSAIFFDLEVGDDLIGKIVFDGGYKIFEHYKKDLFRIISIIFLGMLLSGYALLIHIFLRFIRPFVQMQGFASEVAKGNLEKPLKMTKHNYFGAFTESFDILREELKESKENEYKANISKKELVASLSHDMKTPLAVIKATCEVVSCKENDPDTREKIQIIEQKADMIDQLIGNMFHATLEELENIKIETVEILSQELLPMFGDLKFYGNIICKNIVPECLLYMDPLRMKQVIDNIINNSFKYAGTIIDVTFYDMTDGIRIEIHDYGKGIPDEELPYVTQKFYRGSNGKGKAGSGLGLYLSKYFMESMSGGLECYNENGFVVNLFLRKV